MERKAPDIFDFFSSPFIGFIGGDFPNWFPSWSSGTFLVFILSVFGMIVVFFYNSNLLAYLVKKEFTKPIDSLADIIKSERPYMSNPGVYWDIVQENYPKLAEYAKETSGIHPNQCKIRNPKTILKLVFQIFHIHSRTHSCNV